MGRILGELREVERIAGRKIEEGVRRLKRELDEALGRGSADKVEDGTTGGRMRSRTDEARP